MGKARSKGKWHPKIDKVIKSDEMKKTDEKEILINEKNIDEKQLLKEELNINYSELKEKELVEKTYNDVKQRIIFLTMFTSVGLVIFFLIYLNMHYIFSEMFNRFSILCVIICYYINIIIDTRNMKDLKSVILNFIGIIGLYNIFLVYNPLEMVEMSSIYFISNIFYFYISFLIISFDYNFYKIIDFFIDCILGLINSSQKRPIITCVWIAAFTCLITLLFSKYVNATVMSTVFEYSIAMVICLFFYGKLNIKITKPKKVPKLYTLIKTIIKKCENFINDLTLWILDIFKVEKIKGSVIMKENGIKNKIDFLVTLKNMIVFFIAKIMLPLLLFYYSNTNAFNALYFIDNSGYCQSVSSNEMDVTELNSNKDFKMAILKNDNILVMNEVKNNDKIDVVYFQEIECHRPILKLKINIDYENQTIK